MSNIPDTLKYTKDHEWLKLAEDGTATIGITHHAQESLGDITFVDMPEVGDSFEAEETFGVVESVKAASDLYMPIGGEILEINEGLDGSPESVNNDPYGDGWMIKVKISDTSQTESLLSAAAYTELI